MKSRLARQAERELIESTQRLTAEQRLDAFLRHCRLVTELFQAGQRRIPSERRMRQ